MVKTPTVLLVEDNSELRHVLREALASEGYEVLAARDEPEALELLRERRVDLLISDLSDPPPDSDELEALRREFPDLPVLTLSAATDMHPALFFGSWQSPGRYRTLTRPFRLRELLAVSREVLGVAP